MSDGCAVCEDVEWMADTGESAQQWPARVGMSASALVQHLRRHSRRQLAWRVDRHRKAARSRSVA